MPETRMQLTRRRSADRPDCWLIYYGDVHGGTIAMRVGNPHDTDRWEWVCGFYSGSRPGEIRSGTAATFAEARDGFGIAWKIFLSNRTDADFQAWRHQRDQTERKYAMWANGLKLPTQLASGRSKCLCGAIIDIQNTQHHVYAAHAEVR